MDTAHTHLAGMNPAAAFEKYVDRIRHVHLKDCNPQDTSEDPMRCFVALGDGVLDFRAVVNVLREHGYAGSLIVELDWQRVCNYESARASRRYLRRNLGM
jgi:inosose dehydratase